MTKTGAREKRCENQNIPAVGMPAADCPPVSGYLCKYAPAEVLAGFGLRAELIEPREASFEQAEGHLYPSICSFSKSVLQHIMKSGYAGVLFTDCCDAMKRARDVLEARNDTKAWCLSLPRSAGERAAGLYARAILAWIGECEEAYGAAFDMEAFLAACKREPLKEKADYIAVLGARAPRALLEESSRLSTLPVRDLTCGQQERVFTGQPESEGREAAIGWYAAQLLAQTPCMRMAENSARKKLLEDKHLKGIIYHTIKFCDFYGFEYASLPRALPVVKLETDFTPASAGQLKTRLQAFLEAAGMLEKEENQAMDGENGRYYAGIDIGSTSTNVVIVDAEKNMVASVIIPTGAKSGDTAAKAMDEALRQADITPGDVARTVATGYGRGAVPFGAENITEITCHARGAAYLFPQARTVVDIGGQDSKIIRLTEAGGVVDFSMNDKCAAGTGRFLELMADTLDTDLDRMSELGTQWTEDIGISSMCAVFAESEVISLIAQNKELRDIVRGVNLSIAGRVAGMASRQRAQGPFVMTGGVAQNKGVVMALEEKMDAPLHLPEQPQLCGALGAALIASEADSPGSS